MKSLFDNNSDVSNPMPLELPVTSATFSTCIPILTIICKVFKLVSDGWLVGEVLVSCILEISCTVWMG
jgi:hypothetical protein